MASISLEQETSAQNGLRPVNLKTDLAQLADLIELAFADTMDSSGRAAIREMRSLSRIGIGLNMLSGMNDMVSGIGMGFVWVENQRLIGNVSIYPANLPRQYGQGYIIANVAVHPEYRGRGIARALMNTSIQQIRKAAERARRRPLVLLQVESDNTVARGLYQSLNFIEDGTWVHYRRNPSSRPPHRIENPPYITRRRRGEWLAEYQLARRLRSDWNGMGWLRPLHAGLFNRSIWGVISDFINLRSQERLIIRSQDEREVQAALWIENAVAGSARNLTLTCAPEYTGLFDDALINLAVRRFGSRSPLTIDHPDTELVTAAVLAQYQFTVIRKLTHMRWMG